MSHIRLRPTHHAILGYLEWHCDRGIPFRTQRDMAAELARNVKDVERAFGQLQAWGLVSVIHDELWTWFRIRLGDGRETPPISARRGLRLVAKSPLSTSQRDSKNETNTRISASIHDMTERRLEALG